MNFPLPTGPSPFNHFVWAVAVIVFGAMSVLAMNGSLLVVVAVLAIVLPALYLLRLALIRMRPGERDEDEPP